MREHKHRSRFWADYEIITVIVPYIPRIQGTLAAIRRGLFKTGMTVGEYLEAADHAGSSSLIKAVKKGWITISPLKKK